VELHYAFIKNDRVKQIAVFASQDEALANRIVQEQDYNNAVWVGEETPMLHSFYNGTTFVEPTLDYLYEIGVSQENTAMMEAAIVADALRTEARLAAEAAQND
jgi:hypothetical protein